MIKGICAGASMALVIASALASAQQEFSANTMLPEHETSEYWDNELLEEEGGEVVGVQPMDMGELLFVEGQEHSYLISADGRFVFRGQLQDRWLEQDVTDLEAAVIAQRVPLRRFPVDIKNDMATINIGEADKRQAAAFIDPTTQYSRDLVAMAIEHEQDVNITFILLPAVGGDEAARLAVELYCSNEPEESLRQLANDAFQGAEQREGCRATNVAMNMMYNKAFKVEGIPTLIREDGRRIKGNPQNLRTWLGID